MAKRRTAGGHLARRMTATSVTITGTDFRAGVRVWFGAVEATVTNVTSTEITCDVPCSNTPGVVDVTVDNNDGTDQAVLPGGFEHLAHPTISDVDPPNAPCC